MQNNSILNMAKGLNASKKKVDVDVDADGDLSYGNADEIVMPSEDFDMNTSTTNEETLPINTSLEESSITF